MSSIDTPKDHSDNPQTDEQKLIVALTQVDILTEAYIRSRIGDDAYEAHLARTELDRHLDSVIDGDSSPFEKTPAQLVGARAAEIAQKMVQPGEGLSAEIDAEAHREAFREWLESMGPSEADDYGIADSTVRDEITEVVNLEIGLKHPGMRMMNVHEGLLNFEVRGDDGLTLRILFQVDGFDLKESASYIKLGENGLPALNVPIDIEQAGGEFDGINIKTLKSDAILAIQAAMTRVQQMIDSPTNEIDDGVDDPPIDSL